MSERDNTKNWTSPQDDYVRDGLSRARKEIAEKAILRAENARLRAQVAALLKVKEAAERISKGDICVSLMSRPPRCQRAYWAREALTAYAAWETANAKP